MPAMRSRDWAGSVRRREVAEKLPELVELFQRDLPMSDCAGWATSAVRTVMDVAPDLLFDEALCVADSALRHGAVTQEGLLEAAGTQAQRRVARYADGRRANPFESTLYAQALAAGTAFATTCWLPPAGACCGSPGNR